MLGYGLSTTGLVRVLYETILLSSIVKLKKQVIFT